VRVFEAFAGGGESILIAGHEDALKTLRLLHQGGMAMAAGTWAVAPAGLAGANWWVNSHAYTVLDYDEASQTVSMRNPWGSHPNPDGYFTLSLATFLQGFEFASYSVAPAQ
jgi:hypothetical protein